MEPNGDFNMLLTTAVAGRSTSIYKLLAADQLTTSVELMVDMNSLIAQGTFTEATESVDLVANANEMGNSLMQLNDTDGDGIYNLVVTGLKIGTNLHYKYRINGQNDDRAEFASSSYLRTYNLREGENQVLDRYNATGGILSNSMPLNNADLSIYPNPAKNQIVVSFMETPTTAVAYQIIDLRGKIRTSGMLKNAENIVLLTGLKNGMYFLRIEDKTHVQTKKFIVEN